MLKVTKKNNTRNSIFRSKKNKLGVIKKQTFKKNQVYTNRSKRFKKFPMKGGSSVADDDQVHLITDLERYLRTVSKSFSELTNADQVENLNTIATDYSQTAQILADEANIAAGNNYYPSSNGFEVGTRTNLGIVLDITQIDFDIEISNDQTTWINATKTIGDVEQGSNGYDNTHYTEAAGGSATFGVVWEKIEFRYFRILAVRNNAANSIEATLLNRAH